jgi:hypothetical protein
MYVEGKGEITENGYSISDIQQEQTAWSLYIPISGDRGLAI